MAGKGPFHPPPSTKPSKIKQEISQGTRSNWQEIQKQ